MIARFVICMLPQAFVAFFVSPDARRFKSLHKTTTAIQICQPHYGRDEMLCVVPFAMPDSDDASRERRVDEVMYRFDGNLRALFAEESWYEYQCDRQDKKIERLASKGVVQTLTNVEKLPDLSHSLVKLCPAEGKSGYYLQILSEYVKANIAFTLEWTQLFRLRTLLQFTSPQNEFELYCQSGISRGGTFLSRCLHSTQDEMILPKVESAKMFHSLDEIRESRELKSLYWHPQKPNFPAADAVTSSAREDSDSLPEFIVFEFTTAQEHKINFDGGWDLLKELNIINRTGHLTVAQRLTKLRLRYVFVVPPRNFHRLQLNQKFTQAKKYSKDWEKRLPILEKAIEQYVITCDDFKGF